MIDERKIELMTRLVDEYIASAHPVGSLVLVERYRLSWSTATIRNEMALLEEAGYMFQPYTSSGRVPTQRGYRLYIEHMRPAKLSTRASAQLADAFQSMDDLSPRCLKNATRVLADVTEEIAFVFDGTDCVVAGMQYLSAKPEFSDEEFMEEIVQIIDTLDQSLQPLYEQIHDAPTMFIGDAKRFGRTCSVVLTAVVLHKKKLLVGVLGPLRMNYSKNISALQALHSHS